MRNVAHDSVQRAAEELFVFIVHREDDEELCAARRVEENLAQGVALVFEVVWVASCGGVAHVGKFAGLTIVEAVEEA